MANPGLGDLTTEITDTIGVMKSAETALSGVAQKIADAVAAALKNGATETELQPVIDLGISLKSEAANLAAAVAANP